MSGIENRSEGREIPIERREKKKQLDTQREIGIR